MSVFYQQCKMQTESFLGNKYIFHDFSLFMYQFKVKRLNGIPIPTN